MLIFSTTRTSESFSAELLSMMFFSQSVLVSRITLTELITTLWLQPSNKFLILLTVYFSNPHISKLEVRMWSDIKGIAEAQVDDINCSFSIDAITLLHIAILIEFEDEDYEEARDINCEVLILTDGDWWSTSWRLQNFTSLWSTRSLIMVEFCGRRYFCLHYWINPFGKQNCCNVSAHLCHIKIGQ